MMPYNEKLAERIRQALSEVAKVEEKKMFRGITFMVDGKMCINVSGDELMCRFDPALQAVVEQKTGFRKMVMGGREYKGFGYINADGIKSKKNFEFWISLSLAFNKEAKSSKKA